MQDRDAPARAADRATLAGVEAMVGSKARAIGFTHFTLRDVPPRGTAPVARRPPCGSRGRAEASVTR